MPQTKLIYGVGRVPRASEFALGEIIVNVDDSKVYSKNKLNVVFEITGTGGGGSQLPVGDTIINEGDDVTINVTSQQAFATASVSGSGFFTSVDVASNLIISGGGGISVTTGSGNQLFITTGSSFTVATASFVQTAQTASYVDTFNLYGGLFNLESGDTQGQIIFSDNIVDVNDLITAEATNLSPSSDVEFRNITSSAGISASGDVFVKRLRLPSGVGTNNSGIIFDDQAGNSGFIYDDGTSLQIGYNDTDILTVSSSAGPGGGDIKLLVNGGTRIANGQLVVEGIITSSGTIHTLSHITSSGNISASGELQAQMLRFTQGANNYIRHTDNLGVNIKSTSEKINIQGNITASGAISASSLLFASASQPAAHAGSIVAVVYDTGSGRFYYTGSYGAGGGSGNDGDWFIDTNRLTSSLDVYVRGDITGSNLMITGSGGISLDPAGDSVESVAVRYRYGADSDNDSKRIIYQKTSNNYKTLFMQDSQEFIRFENNTSPTSKNTIINFYGTDIDFVVKGNNDDDLIYANAGIDKVGIGFSSPTQKLSVDGNIYSDGYLLLASKANIVGVAGALLYSSSNEFYLGFSS